MSQGSHCTVTAMAFTVTVAATIKATVTTSVTATVTDTVTAIVTVTTTIVISGKFINNDIANKLGKQRQ